MSLAIDGVLDDFLVLLDGTLAIGAAPLTSGGWYPADAYGSVRGSVGVAMIVKSP